MVSYNYKHTDTVYTVQVLSLELWYASYVDGFSFAYRSSTSSAIKQSWSFWTRSTTMPTSTSITSP